MSDAASVPSPCTNVCRMNASTGLCEGCMRTLDEIAGWSTMNGDEKLAVWDELAQRRAGAGAVVDPMPVDRLPVDDPRP